MTDRPRQLTAEGLPLNQLQSQWAAIQEVARDIADEIDFKSEGLDDNFLKRAQYASDFFGAIANMNGLCNSPQFWRLLIRWPRSPARVMHFQRKISRALSAADYAPSAGTALLIVDCFKSSGIRFS